MEQNRSSEVHASKLWPNNLPQTYTGTVYVKFLIDRILNKENARTNKHISKKEDERVRLGYKWIPYNALPYQYRYHISQLSKEEAKKLEHYWNYQDDDRNNSKELHSVLDAERKLLRYFLNEHIKGNNIL